MKTYETWEVIKALSENPKQEFAIITPSCSGNVLMRRGELVWKDANTRVQISDVVLRYKWQLVRTPVTWQEAIQAWLDGKTIRCNMESGQDFELKPFEDGNTPIFNMCWLKKGVWFIGDADE